MTPDPLAPVRRAAKLKQRADDNYLKTLTEAAAAIGYAALGRELGVTRQAVRQMIQRSKEEEA